MYFIKPNQLSVNLEETIDSPFSYHAEEVGHASFTEMREVDTCNLFFPPLREAHEM